MSVIREERLVKERSMTEKGYRLLQALPLLSRVFPLYIVLVLCGAALPNIFRWYSGLYTNCINKDECEFTLISYSFGVTAWPLFLLVALIFVMKSSCWLLICVGGKIASLDLLAKVLDGLGRVRVTFFDENPSGRIRKRLISDYQEVRQFAMQDFSSIFHHTGEIVAAIALVSLASPMAAVLVIPLVFSLVAVQRRLLPGINLGLAEKSRSLAALAPALDDLLEGKSTFKRYGKEHSMRRHVAIAYEALFDAAGTLSGRMAWSRFSLNALTEVYTSFVMLIIGLACVDGSLSYITGGVVISAVAQLSMHCKWLAMSSSFLEGDFVASERLLEYGELPQEESDEGHVTPASSPHLGITFVNFTASYRSDTPVILRRVNCHISPGKKTALMGRSGCGKSSLIQALLRMLYVQEGDILIDGRSIYTSEARAHRELFSVVPQHPYLFSGSVRDNLDRARNYSDEEVSSAVQKVGLSYQLDFRIQDDGSNLSMGERQLLSLARAVLRKRPILIMDEPTSLVDGETDRRIQRVLRREFQATTVITIAHRVETIEDYDFAILMQDGEVMNVGTPDEMREEAQALREVA